MSAAAVYSGEQGEHTEERNDALNKLKKGELKIIFSVDMFNEGIDVPAIDTVLFLRPTESPTVFLQQLGRGLRPFKDKEYLNVLDFIGNYKKASLIPFLLSGKEYESKALGSTNPMEMEFPDECHIDFDFRLIDLFKKQAESELSAKDNPIKFLKQSASDFFKDKWGYEIALADEIEPFTQLESFKMHYKDIVELRVLTYYKERFEAKGK